MFKDLVILIFSPVYFCLLLTTFLVKNFLIHHSSRAFRFARSVSLSMKRILVFGKFVINLICPALSATLPRSTFSNLRFACMIVQSDVEYNRVSSKSLYLPSTILIVVRQQADFLPSKNFFYTSPITYLSITTLDISNPSQWLP